MEVAPSRPGPSGSPGRALRAMAAEWPFTAVFTLALAAVVMVCLGGLKRGIALLAASMLLGSVLRFVLPPARAGLLAVRRRGADVITMGLLGLFLLLLVVVFATL